MAASFVKWILVIQVGLGSIWAFLGHYFKTDEIARFIGWPEGNPFQKEIAFANLGLGVSGVLCLFFDKGFWLATMIFTTAFLVGAFSVHVGEQKRTEKPQPGQRRSCFLRGLGRTRCALAAVHFRVTPGTGATSQDTYTIKSGA